MIREIEAAYAAARLVEATPTALVAEPCVYAGLQHLARHIETTVAAEHLCALGPVE